MIKLVSIIIPCYNSEKYIRETVLSVINQTYENIEILCVDNGSTDGTLKILNTLKSDFPQIQLLIQPKKGAPAARNLGLDQSKGEVIQFLDSDDLLIPNKIEKQIKFMIESDCDIVVSDRSIFNSDMSKLLIELKFDQVQYDPLLVAFRDIIITGNPIYKRSLFEKYGDWDESLKSAQDWELNIRMAIKGARFGYLPGSLLKCRSHSESLSFNWINVSRSGIQVIEKWKNELLNSNILNNPEVQKKIFYCYFDVSIADNDSKNLKSIMAELNIPVLKQLHGKNKLIAKLFGISSLIKLNHTFSSNHSIKKR